MADGARLSVAELVQLYLAGMQDARDRTERADG